MTDPSSIKLNADQIYCKFCRGLLLPDNVTEQETQQGYHNDCHTDIDAYAKTISNELAVLQQLEELLGHSITITTY